MIDSFKIGDKVVCIDDSNNKHTTYGKVYRVIDVYGVDYDLIQFFGDDGRKTEESDYRFRKLSELRKEKLFRILF